MCHKNTTKKKKKMTKHLHILKTKQQTRDWPKLNRALEQEGYDTGKIDEYIKKIEEIMNVHNNTTQTNNTKRKPDAKRKFLDAIIQEMFKLQIRLDKSARFIVGLVKSKVKKKKMRHSTPHTTQENMS
jgi:uncharacterized protein Smg (DUF494 family)